MAYQALYRKYRPQTFSDVVGQEHITLTLKNELDSGKISHAYLFTGTRGTGKTTCAKILAKAVNCLNPVNGEPCCECELCRAAANDELTDIVELDAASNNGVDYIRELREQVSFSPAAGKYRVYIIDEVHMLSQSAFNALLKTLEEPPSHVVFILATTEVHKIPATILSRCQRFDFRRIDSKIISERIKYVAEKENLEITDDAATLIASAADGGMRDALSILDLCASNNKEIDESTVANVCAMAGNDYLIKLADFIKDRDTENAMLLIDELHNSSVDMLRLLADLTNHYRNLMIAKTVQKGNKPIVCSVTQLKAIENQAEKYELSEILSILTVLQQAASRMQTGNRRCEMEMTVIRLCTPSLGNDLASLERRIAALEAGKINFKAPALKAQEARTAQKAEGTEEIADDEIPMPQDPNENPAPVENPNSNTVNSNNAAADSQETAAVECWPEILSVLRGSCPLIAGVLANSKAYTKGQYLLIDTDSTQFKTLVNGANPVYRDQIRSAAEQLLGVRYKLGPYRKPQKAENDPLISFAEKLKNLNF